MDFLNEKASVTGTETRFAHSEGLTDVAITDDGSKLLTCGSDGDIRVWKGFDDEDPVTFSATDSCLSMTTYNNIIYIGTENHTIEMFELPNGKQLGCKTKFTAGVNHIDISKDGLLLVGGSGDMSLQFILLNNSSVLPKKIESAHQAPVLSVAIDPLSKYVASSGCDGCVCIWSISISSSSVSTAVVKRFENLFTKTSDISLSSTLCRLAWSKEGKQLAFPINKNRIGLYSREDWTEEVTFSHKDVTKMFSVVRFSPCDKIIAGGAEDGSIVTWDLLTKNCLFYTTENCKITAMTFSMDNNLYLTDGRGRFIHVKNFRNSSSTTTSSEVTDKAPVVNNERSPTTGDYGEAEKDVFDDGMDDLFADDDDDENSFSISKIKAEVGFIEDEYVGTEKAMKGVKPGEDDDITSVLSGSVGQPRPQVVYQTPVVNPFTTPQDTFQPSSTPVHLDHRFMVWNNVAIIRNYTTEDEDEAIDIEFHDVNFHAAIHLRNQFGFTMATVSNQAAVFACEKDEDHPSKLFCLNYSTWDSSKEWTADMPKHENIKCIAIGKEWIAAFTSINRLRVFSVGGIQKFIYDLPNQVVSMAGFENLLFVAYHNGVGLNGNQSISYSIFKIKGCRLQPLISELSLPLSPKSVLTWIGFSDEGTPVFYDSKDTLRILNGTLWSPFCCMKEHLNGPNNHFWVVGVNETTQQIHAVKCKGSKYPPTIPRPSLMLIDAKIPICEMDTEKSQLEDELLRSYLKNCAAKKLEKRGIDSEDCKDEADKKIRESLMKLFALSTKGDRDFRAAEYISLMPTSHSVQIAIKYASRLHRMALTERLTTIGRDKLEAEDIDEDDDFDFETQNKTNYIHISGNQASTGENFQPNISQYDSISQNTSYSLRETSALASPSLTISENPFLKKQKDAIRAIESPLSMSMSTPTNGNPFKKQKEVTRPELDNSESQDSIAENGGNTNTSKGFAMIDAWKKIPEKNSFEFNPKNPLRKLSTKKSDKEKDGIGIRKRKSDKNSTSNSKDDNPIVNAMKKQKLLTSS